MTLKRHASSDLVLLIVLCGLFLHNRFAASYQKKLQDRNVRSSGDDLPDCSKCIDKIGNIQMHGVASKFAGIGGMLGYTITDVRSPIFPTDWKDVAQKFIGSSDIPNLRKPTSVCSVGEGYIVASIEISLIKSDEYQMLFQDKVAIPYKACVDSYNKIFDSIWTQVQAFDASSGTDLLLIDRTTLNDLARFRVQIVEVENAAVVMKKTVGVEVEKWNNALSESGKKISKLKSDKVKYSSKLKSAKSDLKRAKAALSKAQKESDDAYDKVNKQRDYDYEPSAECIAAMIIPLAGAACMAIDAKRKAEENAKKVEDALKVLHTQRDIVKEKKTELNIAEKMLGDTEYDLCSTEVVAAFEERQYDSMKDNARLVSLIVPDLNKAVEYLQLNKEKGKVLTTSLSQTDGYIVELENVFTSFKSIGEHMNQLKIAAKMNFSLTLSKEQYAMIQSVLKRLMDQQLKFGSTKK